MPPWQMSAFGRAAGGMASLPCWNPDETTLDLLVMKSGHRTNLLPEMTFNLHTCRPFGMRWLRVAQAALCYYIKHIFHWDVTKIDQKHTSSVLTEIQSPHLFLRLFKRERERDAAMWKIVVSYFLEQYVTADVLCVFFLLGNLGCNHHPVNLHYIGLHCSTKHAIAWHWFCRFFQPM